MNLLQLYNPSCCSTIPKTTHPHSIDTGLIRFKDIVDSL